MAKTVKKAEQPEKVKMAETAKQVKKSDEWEQVSISEMDQYLFSQGTHYDIYKKLGAHFSEKKRRKGCVLCSVGTSCGSRTCNRRIQRLERRKPSDEKRRSRRYSQPVCTGRTGKYPV